ncbi:hypothetical protein MBLNU230_g0052t1 [Neophaeotheca triangularis]
MTTQQDFASLEPIASAATITPETQSEDAPEAESPRLTTSRSPELNRQTTQAARRRSTHSVTADIDDGARMRRPSRTNTVKTYHQPELAEQPNWHPGAEPGIDTAAEHDDALPHLQALKAKCDITIIDFSDSEVFTAQCDNNDLAKLLEEPQVEDTSCRWISVNGLSWDVIKCLGNRYNLHRLAIEDLINTHSRTKVDFYSDHAFLCLTLQKLVRLHRHDATKGPCDCPGVEHYEDDKMPSRVSKYRRRSRWANNRREPDELPPSYLEAGASDKFQEFITAHSGTSDASPIKPIRTLHRYDSAQIPEHTAFMERHSALSSEDLVVSVEQVAMFLLANNTVISFFEHSAQDVEDPILDRLQSSETILRRSCDASLLVQAIIDAVVDLTIPVKDAYNKARKDLQVDALTNPDIKTSRALHIFGEEIDMLQNLFKPIVHLVNALRDHHTEATTFVHPYETNPDESAPPNESRPANRANHRNREGVPNFQRISSDFRRLVVHRNQPASSVTISPLARTYFGDVLDHCITLISTLEQMDASANNISTLIFNTVGARTNNFMYILALVTVFFSPLTFISGYFGMNFANGAGLDHSFAFFWLIAAPSLAAFMIIVFGYMLWDNVKDLLAKRGVREHRSRRKRKRV